MRDFPAELRDAAARMRDAVNAHLSTKVEDRRIVWCAIFLEDGRSDGVAYESRKEAAHHTRNRPGGVFYVRAGAEGMGERESLIVLQQARQSFRRGVVFAEEAPITPQLSELLLPFIPNTLHTLGGIIRPQTRRTRNG
jgi:hypothetical protein